MSTDEKEKEVEYPRQLEMVDVLLEMAKNSSSVPHAMEMVCQLRDGCSKKVSWWCGWDEIGVDGGIMVTPGQHYFPPGWLLFFSPRDGEKELRWYHSENAARVGILIRHREFSAIALDRSKLPIARDSRRAEPIVLEVYWTDGGGELSGVNDPSELTK